MTYSEHELEFTFANDSDIPAADPHFTDNSAGDTSLYHRGHECDRRANRQNQTPQPPSFAKLAAEFLSAENPPKKNCLAPNSPVDSLRRIYDGKIWHA